MISLFIDTSNSDVSIAICKSNILLSSISKNTFNEHSVYAVSFIDDILKESRLKTEDIDEIVVVDGPGSFTGIRIGLGIAKVYGYALNKKVRTLSSLKALAFSTNGDTIISVIDARNDNYYFGVYDSNYKIIIDEQFNNKEVLLDIINKYPNAIIVGYNEFNIDNYEVRRVDLDILNIVKRCDLVYNNIHHINPRYLKLPQVLEK